MNFTIMTTEDVQGNIQVNLDKTGNKYLVGLYNTETKEYTHKTFDELKDALVVYTKYVEIIANGWFDYEERKRWLK